MVQNYSHSIRSLPLPLSSKRRRRWRTISALRRPTSSKTAIIPAAPSLTLRTADSEASISPANQISFRFTRNPLVARPRCPWRTQFPKKHGTQYRNHRILSTQMGKSVLRREATSGSIPKAPELQSSGDSRMTRGTLFF